MSVNINEFLNINSLYRHQGLRLQHQKSGSFVHLQPLSSRTEGLSAHQLSYHRPRTEVLFWDSQTTRALRIKWFILRGLIKLPVCLGKGFDLEKSMVNLLSLNLQYWPFTYNIK